MQGWILFHQRQNFCGNPVRLCTFWIKVRILLFFNTGKDDRAQTLFHLSGIVFTDGYGVQLRVGILTPVDIHDFRKQQIGKGNDAVF